MKNGRIKTRLIHDLRLSLVNAEVTTPERIVLPRLKDAINMLLRIIETRGNTNLLVLDFKDAFKHLGIRHDERRFLAGAAEIDGEPGFFVYKTLLFGIVSGPLLWGRLAAFVMRASCATLDPEEADGPSTTPAATTGPAG